MSQEPQSNDLPNLEFTTVAFLREEWDELGDIASAMKCSIPFLLRRMACHCMTGGAAHPLLLKSITASKLPSVLPNTFPHS